MTNLVLLSITLVTNNTTIQEQQLTNSTYYFTAAPTVYRRYSYGIIDGTNKIELGTHDVKVGTITTIIKTEETFIPVK